VCVGLHLLQLKSLSLTIVYFKELKFLHTLQTVNVFRNGRLVHVQGYSCHHPGSKLLFAGHHRRPEKSCDNFHIQDQQISSSNGGMLHCFEV